MEVSRTHLERWSAWLRRAADLAETGRAEPEDFCPVIQEIAAALATKDEPAKPEQPKYVTRKELGVMYRLSPSQVSVLCKQPDFPDSVRIGSKGLRIPLTEAKQYMERRKG